MTMYREWVLARALDDITTYTDIKQQYVLLIIQC